MTLVQFQSERTEILNQWQSEPGSNSKFSSSFTASIQPPFKACPYLEAAFVIREAPSPFHIYFHGNPFKAFCRLKTTFAFSSCRLPL